MWCYKKMGFESHLLAELQRQQHGRQFCDTLLKTEGVSVPAHSCVLSAISPHISCALSSLPPPPAGQSHLLEFRALSACTLLRMVRLLYSGEMEGEGEEEKQEAISAAAELGIHGLVEIAAQDHKSKHEVGVQTEPLMPEENEGRWGGWRREAMNGGIFLWKEKLSDGGKDIWTQTEELQANTAPPSYPAATFETIDMAALQSLGQTDPHLLQSNIPYIPISLVYPLNDTNQPSPAPVNYMQESTAAGHTSVSVVAPPYTSAASTFFPSSSQATLCSAEPQSWCPQRAAGDAEAREDESVEQFQGNIPGYISYFLNPDKVEDSCSGTAKRRRGARVGGAMGAETGEKRARRPRASTRGGGGKAREVLRQEVGVSKLSKLLLQRCGTRAFRTGQGGGAAGRKLYLKTRELLKSAKSCQRRRVCCTDLEFSPGEDMRPVDQGGAASKTRRGRRSKTQQFNQDNLPVSERPQRVRAKPTASVSFSFPPVESYNVHTSSGTVPPLAPPPHEEQPEHLDRLLEELLGYNILPNNDSGAPQSKPPLPTSSGSCASSEKTLAQNKQGYTTDLLEAGLGFQGSTKVVAVARGASGSISANSEVPVLQQQEEGELTDILEHFLQSFEQHIDNCAAREEVEIDGQSCTGAPVRSSYNETIKQTRHSKPDKHVPTKYSKGSRRRAPATRKKRSKNQPLLEKKSVNMKQASSNNSKTRVVHDRGDQQLQQMPVVKLERTGLLPAQVILLGHSCQSLEVKIPAKTEASFSAVRCPNGSRSVKNQSVWRSTKIYPIRSRLKKANLDSTIILEEPLGDKWSLTAGQPVCRRSRDNKNVQLLSSPNANSSSTPIQTHPEEEGLKNSQDRHEESVVQQQEAAGGSTRKRKKRGVESNEETADDATVAKRVCLEQMPQLTAEDFDPAATETEDIIDVESVSLTSVGGCSESEEREEKVRETEECLRDEEMESSCDEIINVDGDWEDGCERRTASTLPQFTETKLSASPPSHSEISLGLTGSWEDNKDEDIDVIGGSSPVPDLVIINWTESSEGEKEDGDEEVDVVGEKGDCDSSVVFAAVNKGELVNRKCQTEVLSH